MHPVSVVEAVMKQIKLALSSEQASKLAHCELAVVRDLASVQFKRSSSWHNKGEADIIGANLACLKLYVRPNRVTDKCSKH